MTSPPIALAEIAFPWVDPVAIDLPWPLDVRWYGLMYLVGFGAGYLILRRLVRRGDLALQPSAVGDLVGWLVLGVIIGGRLGYILFYDLGDVIARPLETLRVWEGGMSFHGGLLGVAITLVWFARRRRVPLLGLADALALAAPVGIAAVRVANFINGELYGRVAGPDVPWAVRFPTDPVALRLSAEGLSLPGT
jgi:phosphatidylglycerol:prolipoprotein diacylglycerol transferase